MKKISAFARKYIPKVTVISFIAAIASLIALVLSVKFVAVADLLNGTVSTAFRIFMSVLSSPIPFSVCELLICASPLLLILIAIFAWRRLHGRVAAIRFLFAVLCIPAFIFSGFTFALGIPYHTTELDRRMGFENIEIGAQELKHVSVILRDEINSLAEELSLSADEESHSDMSMAELSRSITDAYASFSDEYGFPFNFYTRAKPVFFDGVMSSSHLLGIYTFFTGESNINTGYPDYTVPFTTAHEFAHQRGIIREDEANFLAFAVCIRSDDPYIRYSGYLNMYEYTVSALYRTDVEAFREVHMLLSDAAFADIRASSAHSEKYADSKLGEAVGNANDAYLQMNGTAGRISYSLSVRLTVAYYYHG